jgi:hypothetical protein
LDEHKTKINSDIKANGSRPTFKAWRRTTTFVFICFI